MHRVRSPAVTWYPEVTPWELVPLPQFLSVLPAPQPSSPDQDHSILHGPESPRSFSWLVHPCVLFLGSPRANNASSNLNHVVPSSTSLIVHPISVFSPQCRHYHAAVNNLRCCCFIDHAFVYTPYVLLTPSVPPIMISLDLVQHCLELGGDTLSCSISSLFWGLEGVSIARK